LTVISSVYRYDHSQGTAMTESRSWTWTLTTAGLLQIGMAIAHFGLQYEWRGVDGGSLPPQLLWALFALNFSWSTLVLLVGGLTAYAGRLDPRAASARALVLVMAVFWTVHGIYMVVEPMPVPPRLAWIQGPIVAFPATLILLQGFALLSTRRSPAATTTAPN
jgi:hypothetical protein